MSSLNFPKQPAMGYTTSYKLTVSIIFSLLLAVIPITAFPKPSATIPTRVQPAVSVAIPLEHNLLPRQSTPTTTIVSSNPLPIHTHVHTYVYYSTAWILLITIQHVTGENVCILINENYPACADAPYRPSSYCKHRSQSILLREPTLIIDRRYGRFTVSQYFRHILCTLSCGYYPGF